MATIKTIELEPINDVAAQPPGTMNATEIASKLGISRDTVIKNLRSGKWPIHSRGRHGEGYVEENIILTQVMEKIAQQQDTRIKDMTRRNEKLRRQRLQAKITGTKPPGGRLCPVCSKNYMSWVRAVMCADCRKAERRSPEARRAASLTQTKLRAGLQATMPRTPTQILSDSRAQSRFDDHFKNESEMMRLQRECEIEAREKPWRVYDMYRTQKGYVAVSPGTSPGAGCRADGRYVLMNNGQWMRNLIPAGSKKLAVAEELGELMEEPGGSIDG